MKIYSNTLLKLLIGLLPLCFMSSCESEEDTQPIASVVAAFDYETFTEDYTAQVTFTNQSIAATSYKWMFGSEEATSTEESPTHTFADYGTHEVTLIAFSEEAAPDTLTKSIIIQDPLGDKAPTLYYTDRATGQIHMVILNGSDEPEVLSFGSDHYKPYGICADLDNEKVYVAEQGDWLMYEYDALVNGTKSILLNEVDLGDNAYMLTAPAGVKVFNNRLYWGAEGGIYTSALDGSDLKELVTFSTNTGYAEGSLPLSLTFDAVNNVIYFANDAYDFSGGIYKVNLDGTGLEEIIEGADTGDISYLDGKLYYFDFAKESGVIYDLTSMTEITFGEYPSSFVWGTIADPITKKVYWTDRGANDDGTDGKIWYANLDGSEPKVLLDITNAPSVDGTTVLRPYALALGLY